MPELQPFCAIRYDTDRLRGDLSAVIAPPYDVLDQGDKDALLWHSEHNIVGVDLPHIPPKSAGPGEAYERSASTLRSWLENGVLIRDETPALYLYHQKFEHVGRAYVRRMFIGRLRLAPFSEGSILPHEQTFGGPKEDRLALMKATAVQLSPILGMFTDPEDRVGEAFAATAKRDPDAVGTLHGVENRLWIETDREVIAAVTPCLADKRVFIADGHHRYGTALMYRDWLTERSGGKLPADHPARYIMFVLASMDDPGCLILPYNRTIANVNTETLLDAWRSGAAVASGGDRDLTLFDGRSQVATSLRFTRREMLDELEPEQVGPWYELDYAYLHRCLIDELLAKQLGRKPEVHYVTSVEQAKEDARHHQGVALLTNATPMEHLRAVSEAGGLMPQKSTYFHPKLATGLAINPLA